MLTPIYVLTFAIYYMYVTGMLTSDRNLYALLTLEYYMEGQGGPSFGFWVTVKFLVRHV
jgi:hypothetical protein